MLFVKRSCFLSLLVAFEKLTTVLIMEQHDFFSSFSRFYFLECTLYFNVNYSVFIEFMV